MEHLGLDHVTDCPESLIPEHIKEASAEARRTWFNRLTSEIVDQYVLLPDITEAAEAASKPSVTPIQKNKFPCRMEGCLRTFTYFKSRQTHELKTHNLVMPKTTRQSAPQIVITCMNTPLPDGKALWKWMMSKINEWRSVPL
ncbi:unnamed protein product [Knipowitschia caucasica]